MGPSAAKKRKEHPSNRTLLDFFSNADAIKRARVSTRQELAPSVRSTNLKAASREVIVIDSDSDDDVPGRGDRERNARRSFKTGVFGDSQSLDSGTSTPARTEDKDTFGMPSELLLPISLRSEASSNRFQPHEHSPIVLKPDHSESMFGISAPLLEPTSVSSYFWALCGLRDGLNITYTGNQLTERSQTNLAAHNSMSTWGDSNDPTAEFPIGEWAVGDDELVSLEALGNGAEAEEVEGEPSDEGCFCPVCGISLTGILGRVSAPNRPHHTIH